MYKSLLLSLFSALSVSVFAVPYSHAQTSETLRERGLTFEASGVQELEDTGVFTARCASRSAGGESCHPRRGDQLCAAERPLLCFLDFDAPVPQTLKDGQHWTGGIYALSAPTPAKRFFRITHANAYCAATFGQGWRVASFHDGGGGTLKGYGSAPPQSVRVWIDIKNQPAATCWSR